LQEDVARTRNGVKEASQRVSALADFEVARDLEHRLDRELDRLEIVEGWLREARAVARSEGILRLRARVEKLEAERRALERETRVSEALRRADPLIRKLEGLRHNPAYRWPEVDAERALVEGSIESVRAARDFCSEIRTAVRPPIEYVRVAGGPYTMVATGEKVVLPPRYFVAETETTLAQWHDYQKARTLAGSRVSTVPSDEPVTDVTFDEALAYARWLTEKTKLVSFRLPTEGEWECAARGDRATDYPWGDDWREGHAAVGIASIRRVRSYASRNDLGLFDTVGNAEELTGTILDGEVVVTKGGSVLSSPEGARASRRGLVSRSKKNIALGFRLVAVPKE
jgi:hypothetical protein